MTAHDDVALAPLLTGEAQRTYFSMPPALAANYGEVKREILARLGLSPICVAQQFHDWEYKTQVPARAQAAELTRVAQHWLLEGEPTAAQVVERVVIDHLLRALPRSHRRAVGMRNPATILELVEAIELADAVQHREAGDRAPLFPRRVVQERRTPEGTPRTVSRLAAPTPQDEPMPTAEPTTPPRTWLAGCIVLDSGSAVTLIQSRLCPPHPGQKTLLPITCVHGDTRQVPARRVTIAATSGAWSVEAGLVKDLPVAVLLRRDWPGFERLLATVTRPASPRGNRHRRRHPQGLRRRLALLASDSGRDGESPSQSTNLFYDVFQQASGGGSFAKEQREDDRLKHCWSQRRGEEKELLVVPRGKTEAVLELAHAHPMAGHLGTGNSIQRIRDRFHWPGLDADVKAFCQACPTCQITAPRTPPPSPLILLPIIEVPFERIGLDLVGPLPKSARGHEHILVIVDYAPRYPEAVPLRKATAKAIAQELFLLASHVGIPTEILTDQGTPFMSRLMADLCRLLRFLATWQGPYTVVEKLGPVTYRLRQPGRRQTEQLYHINLLKKWQGTRDQLAALSLTDPVVVDINPQLSAAQKTKLQHLVSQFQDVFSSRPGQTNVIQHDIRTPPGLIVRQRPYRVPESRRQAIEEEIQEMLKLGVIEPSRSPWSSPIVMVPKPDGTLRFCNDFRRLNEVSQFYSYPMPRVDELLDRLGRARGHWQYRTLPFGLHGAPATSQRMMDILLRPHQAYAAAYLDDVVVHSEAWEDHLDWLRRVLSELRRAGLTANPRKCHLAMSEVKYLGFQVGRGLIRPQEKKVEAILTAPKPETKSQPPPLTDLTRKGQPEKIHWTPAAEEALTRIRTALTSAPVLRAPDFSCPFLLQTDASDSGLGAVLFQVQEGEEHPILYISRKLSPAERNYATVEKEALAIRWAVLELRYYFLGRKFTLVTDHAPLQWMARAKDTNARVTRWFLALQDFHFEVRHRGRGRQCQRRRTLTELDSLCRSVRGHSPPTPNLTPSISMRSQGQNDAWGGECDEGYWAHQRRPGYKPAAPARPHHQRSATAAGSLPARLYKPHARYKQTI
ncbi:Retrovirus-related Pol polyprotein from transposon 17.6 [Labeo rohita]|uniref:Gypsy retrotransposon integrase-like protein 1 n=1 Tax=Labeo rohita TaxID=84645 RepID=A0ABQ8L4V9_LABRO|nr:Retrovirus-related Pol polyprotein from transposon 17.6 [Labeo rohita]